MPVWSEQGGMLTSAVPVALPSSRGVRLLVAAAFLHTYRAETLNLLLRFVVRMDKMNHNVTRVAKFNALLTQIRSTLLSWSVFQQSMRQ